MDFTAVDLDASHLAYVREQLELHAKGRRLLGAMLGDLELDRGRLWALVPADRAAQAMADLESDPIRTPAERVALAAATARQLQPLLEKQPPRILAIEWWAGVEDLHAAPAHAFLVGDSEFDYVTGSDSSQLVERLLRSALWFPTVGVIAPVSAEIDLIGARQLGTKQVEEMVACLDLVLVGAWDADGYVFWEPPQDD